MRMRFDLGSVFSGFRGEILFAGSVLGAVVLLILPVPAGLMDFLLVVNIGFAVMMLLLALNVGNTLKLAAFPLLLLVTTLFRLSLNVGTTRLILLQADAGEVVRAFGNFVVQGNPMVGGVIFLILTVVQFIVIAKGAERVAEVTARFTLDAMPGKQMSIDADLRSGAIDQEEAHRRRNELERESQFYGAMDGAMKFVKGDAVAGLIIIAVNILGGLAIGTFQRGIPVSEAVSIYSVLTIGDGLVSQIPALLITVSAGLMVTRVRSVRETAGPAGQIIGQLRAHPEVMLLAGSLLSFLGVVPGMPTLPFCMLGLLLAGTGLLARRISRIEGSARTDTVARGCPVILQLGTGTPVASGLDAALEQERMRVQEELGIAIPPVEVAGGGSKGRWTLLVDEVPVGLGAKTNPQALVDEVGRVLRRTAARFIGVQETQDLLDRLEKVQPALVREVIPRLVPPVLLAEILGRLVEEQVPVRNLRGILSTLAEWARAEADPAVLAEKVREALGAVITRQVAPDGTLQTLLLDPSVEQVLDRALSRTQAGISLALAPEDAERIQQGLGQALRQANNESTLTRVVLTRPELRRPFWKLVSACHPVVRVVSYLELDPAVQVRPAGKVTLLAACAAAERTGG